MNIFLARELRNISPILRHGKGKILTFEKQKNYRVRTVRYGTFTGGNKKNRPHYWRRERERDRQTDTGRR